jgi:hypothetical protein
MLEFNTAGLLIPSSNIGSTLKEFEEYFVIDSPGDVRKILYNQYIRYNNDLKDVCGTELKQWIDGSFVTRKPSPFDIDPVTFVNFEVAKIKEKELKDFIYPSSLTNYGIDGYVVINYPTDHKLYFAYQADCSYWLDQFSKTKPTRRHKRIPKGFLEIIV